MSDPNPVPSPTPAPTPSPPTPIGPLNWQRFIPTNWQSIVGTLAIIAVSHLVNWLKITPEPLPIPEPPVPIWQQSFGWVEPLEDDRRAALESLNVFRFEDTDAAQADAAGDENGNAYLWKLCLKSRGSHVPTLNQGGVGSCVGHGWATGVNYLICIQAALRRGPPIDPSVTIAPEVVYGGSRVNANGGRTPLMGDGSNGSWAARYVTTDGVAARGVYGPYDITAYSESKCREFGRKGIQGELLTECRKNIVGSAALVTNAEDAKKALLQGYPIPICSNVGFAGQSNRDANGFLQARGMWPHCMCVIGYDKGKNAFCIMNSWGEKWVGGPTGAGDPPPGSFWCKWETMDRILKQGDSYAISEARGFPRRRLAVEDWVVETPKPKPRQKGFEPLFATAP